jgi:signal transduction histidine kinase
LINDLLDLARIESGSMKWNKERLYIEDVIENTIAAMAPLFDNKTLSVSTAFSPTRSAVSGDRDRLAQVVINILSNAVKFTNPGGAVRIAVRREDDTVIVEISDTGVGIPASDLESIFEKFRRSGPDDGTAGEGTGLGLSIARQVVEHHGGRIWATRSGHGGSTFTFTLPVDTPSPAKDQPERRV